MTSGPDPRAGDDASGTIDPGGEPGGDLATTLERFQAVAVGLYRFVVVRLDGDKHAADDLMQELWIHAARARTALIADFEPWLRGVARHLVARHWRGRPARRRVHLADPALAAEIASQLDRHDLPDALLARREARAQVLLALTALPADEQALLIRRHFAGVPLRRIAAEAGCTERAVEGRLYRARAALRERLAQLEEDLVP